MDITNAYLEMEQVDDALGYCKESVVTGYACPKLTG